MKEERGVANTKGCLTLSTVLKCVDKCRSNEEWRPNCPNFIFSLAMKR